ncbi:SMI1/KNR4 family protein [Streptomyces sp. NPDC091268]|uniref:SMI1/KNR4 family protein n=1 Tax=Streptomyces sp. NPDC091268 TaxID=3365979 RepID=UPI00382A7075
MPSHPGIRALADLLIPCSQSGEGAPHDLAGVAEAERRLRIRLPADYVDFIRTYGSGGVGGDPLWIPPPYDASGGESVVGSAELFWEQAPESYAQWLPSDVNADMLIRWGFIEDGTHLFWLMNGDDSNGWPIAELYEDGGPFTVHEGGFAAYVQRWCTPVAGCDAEPVRFIHWRVFNRLLDQGLDPTTGIPGYFPSVM